MSIVSKLKKNELKLVAEKIGLTVPGDAKMIDLNRLIEESDVFKEDYEFVKSVIEQVLEEVKTQKSQLNGEIELERLKLERVQAELKLAKLRSRANNSETSLNGGETEASIDFDTLKEPIVSDKMFQTIDRETAAHINIKQSGDWFRPLQLGKECDLYFTSSGAEATLANIRFKFWIVNGRSKVKRVIKQCIKCLKVSAKGKNQMMADLPSARVSIARVFNKVGLDFCGPFLIKLIPGR
ncbi:integrase catalytic domain-containing protein [Trichonephila clavata]|uniref:Integrase catalytic domain-containing protein n=1 Tax=Trichonephila clavata TaxID=2740835 RepID=A0A8X6LPR8_TRICU|nr:integrase catalytic domain-containing protein [Trichonephila clavata]